MCKIGSPLLSFLLCSLCTPLQALRIILELPNTKKMMLIIKNGSKNGIT
ncbi:hypothetical protein BACCAP_04335 [Pseudoflavonifractor capillosus ATCC 29799]|uniref:Uncharacterized protein n=1 Tax=Pseudoflavonifractor capillosus ATCC 29799 TaxID=411467 RepID=A6P1G8_9FIRM|nr:hypothetical protein BACCAP_04335 [Pseudoflavonifractor capillosus ATCC 29799]